jgi:predicted Zn-dependent protease
MHHANENFQFGAPTPGCEGFAFSNSYSGGRASGIIDIDDSAQEARFTPTPNTGSNQGTSIHQDSIRIPFNELLLELGGSNRKLLFFKSAINMETGVFYTRQLSVLKNPAWDSDFRLKQITAKLASSNRIQSSILWVCILLFLVAIPLLFQLRKPAADWVTERIPPKMEAQLGDLVFKQFESSGDLLQGEEWDQNLKALTQPLLNAIESTPYEFRFYLIQDNTPNAFAIPGGIIVIHTGLIQQASTPEEVAGVLAHEIGHVAERHSLKNMMHTAGFALLVQSIFGDISGLVAVLGDRATFLMSRKFSREYEESADNFGWDLLTRANIDPRGMIQFFETLEEYQQEAVGETGAKVTTHLEFLSTHPATIERIKNLEAKWQKRPQSNEEDFIGFDLNFDAFKDKINALPLN